MLPLVVTLDLIALGAVATFVGTFGAGGGIFALVLMVTLVNEAPSALVGSVYIMFFVSSAVGLIAFSSAKLIDFKLGMILALPSIPGVIVGTYLGLSFSAYEFKVILGVVTVTLSTLLIFGQKIPIARQVSSQNPRTLTDRSGRIFTYHPKPMLGLVVSAIAGLMAGSVGGGPAILLAPSLILFVGLPAQVALATLRLILFALNSSVVVAHFAINAINFQYGLWLALGAVVGAVLGAKAVYVSKPAVIRDVVAFTLLLFGIYLIISSFV